MYKNDTFSQAQKATELSDYSLTENTHLSVLNKTKQNISAGLRSLADGVDDLSLSDISTSPRIYNEKTIEAVHRGEQIVRNLRNFARDTIFTAQADIYENVIISAKQLNISVANRVDGIIEITLPCMLPHRKKGDNGFISVPLIRILDEFTLNSSFEKFTNCDICITHVYDMNTTRMERIRDHDNFELKKIMDIIAMFLLTSDSGRYCNTHSFTELSDKNMTRVEIMNVDMFPLWIRGHEKYQKTYLDM